MCVMGLLVGVMVAAPTASNVVEDGSAYSVVRFKNGPVIASSGARPFLVSGFEVERSGQVLVPRVGVPRAKRMPVPPPKPGRAVRPGAKVEAGTRVVTPQAKSKSIEPTRIPRPRKRSGRGRDI